MKSKHSHNSEIYSFSLSPVSGVDHGTLQCDEVVEFFVANLLLFAPRLFLFQLRCLTPFPSSSSISTRRRAMMLFLFQFGYSYALPVIS
jgi:hypothetical protein